MPGGDFKKRETTDRMTDLIDFWCFKCKSAPDGPVKTHDHTLSVYIILYRRFQSANHFCSLNESTLSFPHWLSFRKKKTTRADARPALTVFSPLTKQQLMHLCLYSWTQFLSDRTGSQWPRPVGYERRHVLHFMQSGQQTESSDKSQWTLLLQLTKCSGYLAYYVPQALDWKDSL